MSGYEINKCAVEMLCAGVLLLPAVEVIILSRQGRPFPSVNLSWPFWVNALRLLRRCAFASFTKHYPAIVDR